MVAITPNADKRMPCMVTMAWSKGMKCNEEVKVPGQKPLLRLATDFLWIVRLASP
jgi:hypothetical protein